MLSEYIVLLTSCWTLGPLWTCTMHYSKQLGNILQVGRRWVGRVVNCPPRFCRNIEEDGNKKRQYIAICPPSYRQLPTSLFFGACERLACLDFESNVFIGLLRFIPRFCCREQDWKGSICKKSLPTFACDSHGGKHTLPQKKKEVKTSSP